MTPYKLQINNEIIENPTRQQMQQMGLTEQEIMRVLEKIKNYIHQSVYFERKWRNSELTATDKLMFTDATYNGQTVHDSFMMQDIINYRKQLRLYNLAQEARPQRPDWFKG